MQGRRPLGKHQSRATPAHGGLFVPYIVRRLVLCRDKLPSPHHRSVSQGFAPSFFGEVDHAALLRCKTSQGTPYMILDARELAARRQENAAKKKRAGPKARGQIRRGRKVTANIVGSITLVFTKSIMLNTWR